MCTNNCNCWTHTSLLDMSSSFINSHMIDDKITAGAQLLQNNTYVYVCVYIHMCDY